MFDLTLSFDNGPDPEITPHILDVLARRNLPATFFVVGEKLQRPGAREICMRAHQAGHWIGNHTWSHGDSLGRRSVPVEQEEIGRTQDLIGDLSHPDRLFRPAGSKGVIRSDLFGPRTHEFLSQGGYTVVLWNSIPNDWSDPVGWVDTALQQARSQSWTVPVLHELPTGAMAHLERFLDTATDLGARWRQEFPPSCLPVVKGRKMFDIADP
jgi:peptidoglycan/xylan/chitin deacetylase (PgdA/CDA1 family)